MLRPPKHLRAVAEARLAHSPPSEVSARSGKELRHELQVHQIELEMQNEALIDSNIALGRSRDRFVDFYEFAPVGYVTLTDKGLIADINLTGSALLGAERKKILQHRFSSFVIPAEADRYHSHFFGALKTAEQLTCELALQRVDGSHVHVRLDSLRLIKNGQAPTLRVVLTDITDRKQTEKALERSRRVANEAAQIGKVGGWEVDVRTGKQTWTEETYRIHEVGLDYEPTLEKGINFYTPESRPTIELAWRKAVEHGEPYDVELEIITAKGNIRSVHAIGKADIQNGRVYGFFQDITEHKHAEAELIQHRDHLEKLVAARTAELENSRDAAEAGNRAKTIFLANMSHELRTPMNGVIGMTDLALRHATDPKQIDLLNKSKGAAQRMVGVVNDILDFSNIQAGRMPLEEKAFFLSQMIDDAIAMQDLTAEAKGLTLTREIPATFPDQLSGDAFRLRQILLNFLGNACKFSDQGKITVRVSAVEQDAESVLARIEVEDHGIGISPEQQAMLFQTFTQVDGSMTRKYGGSGLGLIISKRLANLMGGEVGVVSQEGRGSAFWTTARLKRVKASEVRA